MLYPAFPLSYFFAPPGEASGGVGVVGTITLRGKSAIVWFGWGAVEGFWVVPVES